MPVELLRSAREVFAGSADVTISHPRFLEFVAPGVSKGRAVRYLARRLRVPLSSVLAIGDQWNDLEMLAGVGHGAAMPSAPEAVRAVARYIAPSLEDDGAGRMIEALALASPDDARAASRRMAADATDRRAMPA
jgi:hydroxymethylpyrimidine pyrophosphatase-like HAD family hydrolase